MKKKESKDNLKNLSSSDIKKASQVAKSLLGKDAEKLSDVLSDKELMKEKMAKLSSNDIENIKNSFKSKGTVDKETIEKIKKILNS